MCWGKRPAFITEEEFYGIVREKLTYANGLKQQSIEDVLNGEFTTFEYIIENQYSDMYIVTVEYEKL